MSESRERWGDVPAALADLARAAGLSLEVLLAERDDPSLAADVPPDHAEEILLRFVAPALGGALDAGRIDRARVEVYVAETAGFPADVVAAAVEISLPTVNDVPIEALGDALADLLDQLDASAPAGSIAAGITSATVPVVAPPSRVRAPAPVGCGRAPPGVTATSEMPPRRWSAHRGPPAIPRGIATRPSPIRGREGARSPPGCGDGTEGPWVDVAMVHARELAAEPGRALVRVHRPA